MLIYNLVRNTGKTYKAIFNESNNDQAKDLFNKYVDIEWKVYKDYDDSAFLPSDLTIAFHSPNHYSYGSKAHLQFDDDKPVIHLISYDTDVADYNIVTGNLFQGYTYSATTSRHMLDFSLLFKGDKSTTADRGTGKYVYDKLLDDHYWTGLSVDCLITNSTNEMDLVDTLAQIPTFDKLFMNLYHYYQNHKMYKYQMMQVEEMITSMAGDWDYFDKVIRCTSNDKLNVEAKYIIRQAINVDNHHNLVNGMYDIVDVNRHYETKAFHGFVVRNFDSSYKIFIHLLKGINKTAKEVA